MDDDSLRLASPAGMLCYVLKAYSVHPVDLTYAVLDKLGESLATANIVAAHHAITAVVAWMERTSACPGVSKRDVLDALTYLDLTDQPPNVRDAASSTVAQLLSWIWSDDICTATGRRQHIAQQLGYPWETENRYPTSPYTRTIM